MEVDQNNPIYTPPYTPPGRKILYVPLENPFMREAKEYARLNSLDKEMPNTSLIVKDGVVIGRGANGSNYHDTHECYRVKNNIPTGTGYELCEGCHPRNHGEARAIADAKKHGYDISGADVYMWGHWWCCENCWNAMISEGIKDVYALEDSEILFNKSAPNNVTGGHQFD
jgi:deoxycytidylate deaminase